MRKTMVSCEWNFHPNDTSREHWLRETGYAPYAYKIIDSYLNEFKNVMRYHCRTSSFSSYALIFLGCFGLVGSVLALITLSRPIFHAQRVSFGYFKALNAIQLVYMFFLIELGTEYFLSAGLTYLRFYPWAALVVYGHGRGLVNVLPAWVNVIVLAAAVERAVACHLPLHFQKISKNQKLICIAAIVAGFPICLSIYLPHVFALKLVFVESNRTILAHGMHEIPESFYDSRPTEWGRSWAAYRYSVFADSLAMLGVGLHCATAALVIWGLVRTARRSSSTSTSVSSTPLIVDLCLLQLCETIPLAISHMFRVAAQQTLLNVKQQLRLPYYFNEIPEAQENLRSAKLHYTFYTLALISGAIAHSLSFYFYLAFCPKVRRGCFDLLFGGNEEDGQRRICGAACGEWIRKSNGRKMEPSDTELQTMRARM